MPKKLKLYWVWFKKGPHGTRIVHREYVLASSRTDACDRMLRRARELNVIRLTAMPVEDDHAEKQQLARDTVARCRKAGH